MPLTVHQFPCLSDNYGFLVHDPVSFEPACIDTPDAAAYLREAEARKWRITQIWNTHWHPDHAGGNAAIKGYVDDIGTAGAGLTAVPWNAAWDAEVQSECTDALNAYDPPTKAETDALLTTAVTESYAADGAAPTVAQALCMILQRLIDFEVGGTTITVRKRDGSTTAFTLTLDDASSPTEVTQS